MSDQTLADQIIVLEAQRDADIIAIYDAMGQATLAKIDHIKNRYDTLIAIKKAEYNANLENKA